MTIKPLTSKLRYLFEKYKTLLTYSGLVFLTFSNFALRKEVVTLKIEIENLKADNQNLIADMVYFNRSFEDFPLPVWQKVKRGDRFIMQYVNLAYYETYLKSRGVERFEYMGSTDFDIYDYKTASVFYARDLSLSIDGGWNRFDESVVEVETKLRKPIDVIKWRIIERNDTLIYGMVVPEKISHR